MKKLFLLCVCLSIVSCFLAIFWLLALYPADSTSRNETAELTIERGSGGAVIAQQLAEGGIIRHPPAFRLLARIQGVAGQFQAGEYAFAPHISVAEVMNKLMTGDIILRQVTVPEGKTSAEIVEIINTAENLKGSIESIPAEGSLLPNTYRYLKDETRQSLITRMQQAMTELQAELWQDRAEGLPFDSWQEAVTLASIVEKETSLAEERTHVAGLYINRLHKGMLLQADPTVAYGVYGGQYADKPLTYKDLRKANPYNTYKNTGLPPGPICNPGREAIAAVLNPASHDDLYMVATGTGGHYFAKTNKQHLKNVAKYRKWQRAQR